MNNKHYWVGEGTTYTCKTCKTSLTLNTDLIAGKYSKSYTYIYPDGDTSTVFTENITDRCPIKEWDLGKWLGDAVEYVPRPTIQETKQE